MEHVNLDNLAIYYVAAIAASAFIATAMFNRFG